ncbi:hypothetical protein CBR_g28082 [Chara braunii]|uniref:Sugar transporter SWEET1 n=1 Tax=Chara braunii TaxID=69332 RepID=A0A388L976_CHABU|nr:hypothetical protein CBR_g28082 [Chara braunii]|eukprot:GBG78857.1 hypothetical protein CBR_g28082 [Chara braunii]
MHKELSTPPLVELSALGTVASKSPFPDIADLLSRQALQVFFGTCGNITGILCLFAPLPTFARIIKKKSTEKFSSLPYITTVLSSAIWALYASPMLANTFQMFTITSLSVIVQAIYVAIFFTYARDSALKGAFINLAAAALIFMGVLGLGQFYEPASDRAAAVGLVGDVLGVASFAAPLSVLGLVIRTKSAEFLPITLILYMGANGLMWLLYAITIKDIYVFLPNMLGVSLSIGQIILYIMYRSPLPEDAEKPCGPRVEETAANNESVWPKLRVKIAKPYLDGVGSMTASPRLIAPLLIRQLSHTINMIRDSGPSTPTVEITPSESNHGDGTGAADNSNGGTNSPAIVYRDGSAYIVKALENSRRPRYRMRVSSMNPRADDDEDLHQPLLTDFTPDWRNDLAEDPEAANCLKNGNGTCIKKEAEAATHTQAVTGT